MDILSKLENIEFQITDRFPLEDMEHCRREELVYQEVYHICSEVAFISEAANVKLKDFTHCPYVQTLDDNMDKVYACSERFIGEVCGYFRKKYAITIDAPIWKTSQEESGRKHKRERYDVVPLQYILDSVYDQMGGMSFEEKAFVELLEDAKGSVTAYNGDSKYVIRNSKLVIDEFYWSHKDSIWERYMANVDSSHRSFFKALTHFEYGYYDVSQKYGLLCGYRIDEKEGSYDKHVISSTIVHTIKVFKNGKIEVEFKDYGTAVKFMETYFPGIPQQEAERGGTK
jgi:hypothetical protein